MTPVYFSASKWLSYLFLFYLISACGDESSGGSGDSLGVSASKAQLIKLNGAVYSLASNKLVRIDISSADQPAITDEIELNFNAETLTTDGEALFIGSPREVRSYQYKDGRLDFVDTSVRQIRGKDPVVTDGNFAYSTVVTREWSAYGQSVNNGMAGSGDLYVYEIDAEKNITELAFYPSIGYVKGLALWGKTLLICDPVDGLIQMDVTDSQLVEKVQQFNFVRCEDVLHLGNGHFATVGEEGIYQLVPYSESNLAVISLAN
ncbi:MAG: hypothetical protein ACI8SR_001214 [Oceanicoccus sp.]|jgi:hypothetical protein